MNLARFYFYFRRAFTILMVWVCLAVAIFLYDYFTLLTNHALPADYDFKGAFIAYLLVAIIAGFIGGVFTVNLMEYWLRKYKFWVALTFIIITYSIVAIIIGAFGGLYLASLEHAMPMWDEKVFNDLPYFFTEAIFIKNYLIWLAIVVMTLIFLLVGEKFGPGVFPDYLVGRYFHPKKENRVFMFTDINDATTIAERLGEERYFHFLKDFFNYISPAITETKGEIYQYVGDEIVVTWKVKRIPFNKRPLRCYYRMLQLIEKKAPYFEAAYGTVPTFKTGFHYGPTMVGEVGYVKREIVFSGDVVNTAARIQAKCNELGLPILASEDFLKIVQPLPKKITHHLLGEHTLKGKINDVKLVTFRNEN